MPIKFDENEFLITLKTLSVQLIRDVSTRDQRGKLIYTREFTTNEQYLRLVLLSAHEILNVCEQMEYSIALMSGFRRTSLLKQVNMTRYDYILYHIENYIIRATMVFDRVLQLVNLVLPLGFKAQKCRKENVLKHKFVKGTDVGKSIVGLDKIIDSIRHQRNIIIHHKTHDEENTYEINLYYVLQKSEDDSEDSDILNRYFHFYKSETDKFVARKRMDLLKFTEMVFNEINKLFNVLTPIFLTNYKMIREEIP